MGSNIMVSLIKLIVFLLGVCFQSESTNGFITTHQSNPKFRRSLCLQTVPGDTKISFDALTDKRILVVGGSGRVGGSVVTQLIKRGASYVTVGGTSEARFESARDRWLQFLEQDKTKFLDNVNFAFLNRESTDSVSSVLKTSSFDLVVHTAGPFQGKVTTRNGVLEACIKNEVAYIDVCDDYCTASAAKTKYQIEAIENGVPCLLSTGCWPGVSSLMAKQAVWKVLQSTSNLKPADLSLKFSFFTAGSGGAGSTLLVATFLILAEKALTVVNGRRRPVQAMKEYSKVNFGPIIGDKDVAHLNLLETASVYDVLEVGNVQALFGTAPGFWNTLLGLMAQLPPPLLSNEGLMEKLAVFSLPIVRVVDYFAGATNAMRCDVMSANDPSVRATMLYGHENLEHCVGECVAAFCVSVLAGAVSPGVWFTEEAIEEGADAAAVLGLAAVGAHTVQVEGTIHITKDEVWGMTDSRTK